MNEPKKNPETLTKEQAELAHGLASVVRLAMKYPRTTVAVAAGVGLGMLIASQPATPATPPKEPTK